MLRRDDRFRLDRYFIHRPARQFTAAEERLLAECAADFYETHRAGEGPCARALRQQYGHPADTYVDFLCLAIAGSYVLEARRRQPALRQAA